VLCVFLPIVPVFELIVAKAFVYLGMVYVTFYKFCWSQADFKVKLFNFTHVSARDEIPMMC